MGNKLSHDYIRDQFNSRGCVLLSKEYTNNKQKLDYICPNGHVHSMAWYHWQEGHGCPECLAVENSKRFRLDFDIVKDSFTKAGYILLTTRYINANQQLEYICSAGHKHFMTWNNWSKGHRCPSCDLLARSGDNHWNWKGGISCEPYCDVWTDKEYKKSILERDGNKCQNPGCRRTSKRLTIHHIDYVKKHCDPQNLITLCNSCNSRANHGRDRHEKFYKDIMKGKLIKNGRS